MEPTADVHATGGDGVTGPVRLPSGRHEIPDHEVRDHQRIRLIDAIAALGVERGYANVVISDIVARAAVSKSTFYQLYRTKDECLFDAHKHHCAGLIAAVERARRPQSLSPQQRLRASTAAMVAYFSAHPPAAHLLTIGILASGPRGQARHRVMVELLSSRLQPDQAGARDGIAEAVLDFASLLPSDADHPQSDGNHQPTFRFDDATVVVQLVLTLADLSLSADTIRPSY